MATDCCGLHCWGSDRPCRVAAYPDAVGVFGIHRAIGGRRKDRMRGLSVPNPRAALGAGNPRCLHFGRRWPGPSEHERWASVRTEMHV